MSVNELDEEGPIVLRYLLLFIAVLFTAFILFFSYTRYTNQTQYAIIFLGVGLFIYYSYKALQFFPISDEDTKVSSRATYLKYANISGCLILGLLSLVVNAYIYLNYERYAYAAITYPVTDYIAGTTIIIIVVDATRREFGNSFLLVLVFATIYALFGQWFPGLFFHAGMSFEELIRNTTIQLTGIYGFALELGATWIAIFVVFAGMAKSYGALDYILDIADELRKVSKGGAVHVAILSSMIVGSISGSAAANTATTGSFTIPMMKEQGIPSRFAASIESLASSGGQILPPVMGLGAFLMADILGIPFAEVVVGAVIPALFFYLAIFIMIHLAISKNNWIKAQTDKTDYDRSIYTSGLHFSVPLIVLVYFLVLRQSDPMFSGFWTVISLLAVVIAKDLVYNREPLAMVKRVILGFRDGAIELAPLIALLCSLGYIIAIITQTGLAQKISLFMISLAGNSLILLAILAMIASILFGLGMPTAAAYLLVAILSAPPLIQMGLQPLNVHLFVFYFAFLSAITPPVAITVAVASNIADSPFLTTCKETMRLGFPVFLIPFGFLAIPSLIYWEFPASLYYFSTITLGIIFLAIGNIGYIRRTNVGYAYRIVIIMGGIVAILAPLEYKVGAIIIVLLTFLPLLGRMDIGAAILNR